MDYENIFVISNNTLYFAYLEPNRLMNCFSIHPPNYHRYSNHQVFQNLLHFLFWINYKNNKNNTINENNKVFKTL